MKPKVWAVILVASSCATLCCTNPRDGLKMSIHPQKASFKGGERIRFDVVFRAEGGTLCLTQPRWDSLRIELTHCASGKMIQSESPAFCGTSIRSFAALAAYPFSVVACLLDVGDCMGRFVVIPDGEGKSSCVELLPLGNHFIVLPDHDSIYPEWAHEVDAFRSKGDYRMKVTFRSVTDGAYPAPLFWKVYDQPVTATAEFSVE